MQRDDGLERERRRIRVRARARRAEPAAGRIAGKLRRQADALRGLTSSEPARALDGLDLRDVEALVGEAIAALELAADQLQPEPARTDVHELTLLRAGVPPTPTRVALLVHVGAGPRTLPELELLLGADRRTIARGLDLLVRSRVLTRDGGTWTLLTHN